MNDAETNHRPPSEFQSHFAWLRTRMAAERTLESWIRTAASLIAFGLTIVLFFARMDAAVHLHLPHPTAPRYMGLAMIGIGTLGLAMSLWRYKLLVNYLRGQQFESLARIEGIPKFGGAMIAAILLCLTGAAAFIIILLRIQ